MANISKPQAEVLVIDFTFQLGNAYVTKPKY